MAKPRYQLELLSLIEFQPETMIASASDQSGELKRLWLRTTLYPLIQSRIVLVNKGTETQYSTLTEAIEAFNEL